MFASELNHLKGLVFRMCTIWLWKCTRIGCKKKKRRNLPRHALENTARRQIINDMNFVQNINKSFKIKPVIEKYVSDA